MTIEINYSLQTISNRLNAPRTPPPAYAITIQNGESLYVPPSYKMTFHSSLSYSQDSYGGMPDFSVLKVDQHA